MHGRSEGHWRHWRLLGRWSGNGCNNQLGCRNDNLDWDHKWNRQRHQSELSRAAIWRGRVSRYPYGNVVFYGLSACKRNGSGTEPVGTMVWPQGFTGSNRYGSFRVSLGGG